jgi:hypothetical protein
MNWNVKLLSDNPLPWGYFRRCPPFIPKPYFDRVQKFRMTTLAILLVVLTTCIILIIRRTTLSPAPLWFMTYGLVSGFWVIWPRIEFHRMRRELTVYDFCVCLNCGYSLKGLPERHTCPECGRDFQIDEVRSAWKYWIRHRRLPRAASDNPSDPD